MKPEGGGYLLSRFRSTIGAAGFNFSVRDGKRWGPRAMAALVCPGRRWGARYNGCLNNMGYSDAGMAKGEVKPLIGLTLDGLRRVAVKTLATRHTERAIHLASRLRRNTKRSPVMVGDKHTFDIPSPIGLTLDGLRRVAEVCGMPRFAAGQMARWLYEKRVGGIDQNNPYYSSIRSVP